MGVVQPVRSRPAMYNMDARTWKRAIQCRIATASGAVGGAVLLVLVTVKCYRWLRGTIQENRRWEAAESQRIADGRPAYMEHVTSVMRSNGYSESYIEDWKSKQDQPSKVPSIWDPWV